MNRNRGIGEKLVNAMPDAINKRCSENCKRISKAKAIQTESDGVESSEHKNCTELFIKNLL